MPQFLSEYELIRIEVFWVSLIGIWLLYGLFAFLVAKQSWHWFIRFAIVAAAVSVLRIIEANDLMLMQMASCMTILTAIMVWSKLRERRLDAGGTIDSQNRDKAMGQNSVWSIATLLWMIAAVAVIVSMLNTDLSGLISRTHSAGFGFFVGVAILLGFYVGMLRSRWVLIIAILFSAVGVWQAYHWIFPETNMSSFFGAMFGTSFIWGELETFALAILVAMAISGLIVGLLYRLNQQTSGGVLLFSRVGAAFAIVILLLNAIASIDVGAKLAFRYPAAKSQQEEETQFDKLLKIADRFGSSQIFDAYPPADEVTLRQEFSSYEMDFVKLAELLKCPDAESVSYQTDDPFECLDHVSKIRTIARALSSKARLEFQDGLADQSLADSILIIRLRQPVSRNRLLVTELTSIAIEGIGHYAATESIPSASRPAIAAALQSVLDLDASPYDPELIYANDNSLMWQRVSWWGRLHALCKEKESRQVFDDHIMQAIRRVNATRQQTITMLALELYRHDAGLYPEQLQSLVPRYLATVPTDPFGSNAANPLKYQQISEGEDYLLYSVGFDQDDDGGRVSEYGYGTPDDDMSDLNFKEGSMLDRLERDAELAEENADDEVE